MYTLHRKASAGSRPMTAHIKSPAVLQNRLALHAKALCLIDIDKISYTSFCSAGQKEGGQALLGGLDCLVQRNFFGAQVDSFETQLPAPAPLCALRGNGAAAAPGGDSFRALFIRAPAVLEAGASVEVLAEYRCVRFRLNLDPYPKTLCWRPAHLWRSWQTTGALPLPRTLRPATLPTQMLS